MWYLGANTATSQRNMHLSRFLITSFLSTLASISAVAAVGPTSTLYLMNYGEFGGGTVVGLDLIQGNTVNSFPTGNPVDICIAASGDIRTYGYVPGQAGSRFDLAGNPLPGGP